MGLISDRDENTKISLLFCIGLALWGYCYWVYLISAHVHWRKICQHQTMEQLPFFLQLQPASSRLEDGPTSPSAGLSQLTSPDTPMSYALSEWVFFSQYKKPYLFSLPDGLMSRVLSTLLIVCHLPLVSLVLVWQNWLCFWGCTWPESSRTTLSNFGLFGESTLTGTPI